MNQIRTQPWPDCDVCHTAGVPLYQDLTERLYGVPGQWSLKQCPNPKCGLIWLDPMPLEEDIHLAYQSYFTHQSSRSLKNRLVQYVKNGYLARTHKNRKQSLPFIQRCAGLLAYATPFRRANTDQLAGYLSTAPRGRLLDVGCGDGSILEFMQDNGWQAEGLDFDSVAVKRARARGLNAQVGTMQSQRYPDNSFAAIVMSHFIEHIHHPSSVLQESHRILRPGGRLILLTPNAHSLAHQRYRSAWLQLDPPRHLHVFTITSLELLLRRAGFRQLSTTTTLRNIGRIITASRCIQRHGRYSASFSRPAFNSLAVAALEIAQWIAWKRNPLSGEEIGLIAEK